MHDAALFLATVASLSAIVAAITAAVMAIRHADAMRLLDARLGILERKEYRLEHEVEDQQKRSTP